MMPSYPSLSFDLIASKIFFLLEMSAILNGLGTIGSSMSFHFSSQAGYSLGSNKRHTCPANSMKSISPISFLISDLCFAYTDATASFNDFFSAINK